MFYFSISIYLNKEKDFLRGVRGVEKRDKNRKKKGGKNENVIEKRDKKGRRV